MYCGHGTPNGSLVFSDGEYSGTRFKSFLDNLNLNYMPKISFYLNCCYSLQFVNHIVYKTFKKFFTQLFLKNDITENEEYLLELLGEDETEKKKIGKMLMECGRSLLSYSVSTTTIYFQPLSYTEMQGSGYLDVINTVSVNTMNLNDFKEESTTIQKRTKFELEEKDIKKELSSFSSTSNDTSVLSPELTIFRAIKGDSALFCYQNNRILIDGGDDKASKNSQKLIVLL